MARVAAGTSSYRLWIYTSAQDTGGAKGHLTLKLAGTLGEVTFAHLEQSPARQGRLFAPGHCCEIFQQDDDVGSMLKLTVQYVSEAAVGGSHVHRSPWNLVQIIVRESATGSVRVFPASRTLTGNEQLLLTPRLTWFEDRYGNCFEEMPKAVLSGQWQWPLMPLAGANEAKDGPGLEASRLSQQAQVQHRLWEAVCKEEIGPLVDEALQDLAQQRTPGTLLYDCMQAAAGRPSEHTTSRVSAEDLRRNNAELKERVCALQEERDREVGERNIATKTIEILEIEKRGLQDHLRSRPDGAYDAARAKEKRRLQGHLRNQPGGAHDAARAKDATTAACVIS